MAVNDSDEYSNLRLENQRLRQSEMLYKSFLCLSSEGIICLKFDNHQELVIDIPVEMQVISILENSVIAECNEHMARMYGIHNRNEIIGVKLKDLTTAFNQINVEGIQLFVESGYRLLDFESKVVDRFGKVKYFINSLIGVVSERKLLAIWSIQRDITDRKVSEETMIVLNEKIKELNLELESNNISLGNFIYTVTHDLNSPMANVEGLLNIIKLDPGCFNKDTMEYIGLMDGAIAKFKTILRRIAEDAQGKVKR